MVTLNYVVARRLFGVEHTLAVLTACGSSICGAAAVMGVAGAAKAKADDSVLAVACVAILGTAFTLVLVALQPVLGFSAAQFGTLAGLSLHEIAHAVAAGGAAGAVGTDAAIVAKLSRVLLLAPVAVLVGVLEARRAVVAKRQAALAGVGNVEVEISPATEAASQGWWAQLKHVSIPWFMGGFLLASAVGTYVPFVAEFTGGLATLAYILLGMAMAALGLNVNFSVVAHKGARLSRLIGRLVHQRKVAVALSLPLRAQQSLLHQPRQECQHRGRLPRFIGQSLLNLRGRHRSLRVPDHLHDLHLGRGYPL